MMSIEEYVTSKSVVFLNIILFVIQFDTFEYIHEGGLGIFSPFKMIVFPLCLLYLCNSFKSIYPKDEIKVIISIIFFVFCFLGDVGSNISNFVSVLGNIVSLLTTYYIFHNTNFARSSLYVVSSWAAIQIPSLINQIAEGSISVFNRFEGLNFDPNYLCSLIIPAIWASVYLLKIERKTILRIYNYIIIILGIIMVFLSYSRGGLIALSITSLFYLLIRNKKLFYISIAVIFSLISSFMLRAQFISYNDAEDSLIDGFIYRNFTTDDVSKMTSGRSDLIVNYLDEISKGNLIVFGSSLPEYIQNVNKGAYSHNGFIDLCVQGGLLVGSIFCVLLLFCILLIIYKCIKFQIVTYEFMFLLSIFISLISLAFSAKLIWIVIGILLSISNQLYFDKYLTFNNNEDFDSYTCL